MKCLGTSKQFRPFQRARSETITIAASLPRNYTQKSHEGSDTHTHTHPHAHAHAHAHAHTRTRHAHAHTHTHSFGCRENRPDKRAELGHRLSS